MMKRYQKINPTEKLFTPIVGFDSVASNELQERIFEGFCDKTRY